MEPTGVEPVTSRMPFLERSNASDSGKELAETPLTAYTAAYTNLPKKVNATPLDALAAALLGLSADDRARIADALLASSKTDVTPN